MSRGADWQVVPLSGPDPARDADDATETTASEPRPVVPRGRFGVAEFPVDASLDAGDDRALPTRKRVEPDDASEQPRHGRRPVVVGLAVALVMAVLVAAGVTFVLGSGGPETGAGEVTRPTVPSTSLGFVDITVPPTASTASTTSEPWAPEIPDPDLIVYPTPGLIQPGEEIVEFRDASTVETLVLANTGGGAANWVLSVQAGSGLDVSPDAGQLKPGEEVEVRILLDRENGRPLTDWAEDITMIGGGNTRPTSVKVKIFAL